jgi:signal transduction histidine kinase
MKNPIVDIDRDQITQVILNLVNNAFDAMGDEEGQLIVTLLDKEDKVTIEVRDTGPGIPDDIVKKVFEPFFTTKSIGKGTGLGLSITYGIVKMHNGDISLKTNCDPAKGPTGTTFRVVLPRHGHG